MTKTVARAKIASLRIFSAVSDPIRASPLIKLRRGSRCENGITHFTLPCRGRVAHRRCAEWGRAILRRGSVCPYPRASLANLPCRGRWEEVPLRAAASPAGEAEKPMVNRALTSALHAMQALLRVAPL